VDQLLIDQVTELVSNGWTGLITLYVVWAVIKQFRVWKSERKSERKSNGKHNPSPEVHSAIDAAVNPINARLTRVEDSIARIDRRVARMQGHLDLDHTDH
jgi:hypothetical protein